MIPIFKNYTFNNTTITNLNTKYDKKSYLINNSDVLNKRKQNITVRFLCSPKHDDTELEQFVQKNFNNGTLKLNYIISVKRSLIKQVLPLSFNSNEDNNITVSIMVNMIANTWINHSASIDYYFHYTSKTFSIDYKRNKY